MALMALILCQVAVSAYDIDDSVLHKITFAPHGDVYSKQGEEI